MHNARLWCNSESLSNVQLCLAQLKLLQCHVAWNWALQAGFWSISVICLLAMRVSEAWWQQADIKSHVCRHFFNWDMTAAVSQTWLQICSLHGSEKVMCVFCTYKNVQVNRPSWSDDSGFHESQIQLLFSSFWMLQSVFFCRQMSWPVPRNQQYLCASLCKVWATRSGWTTHGRNGAQRRQILNWDKVWDWASKQQISW